MPQPAATAVYMVATRKLQLAQATDVRLNSILSLALALRWCETILCHKLDLQMYSPVGIKPDHGHRRNKEATQIHLQDWRTVHQTFMVRASRAMVARSRLPRLSRALWMRHVGRTTPIRLVHHLLHRAWRRSLIRKRFKGLRLDLEACQGLGKIAQGLMLGVGSRRISVRGQAGDVCDGKDSARDVRYLGCFGGV